MDGLKVRPITNADIPTLMGMDHSSITDHVWQLELRRDVGGVRVSALFREVRLPRPVPLAYPNELHTLADSWKRLAAVWLAEGPTGVLGYLCLSEPREGLASVTDLAVTPSARRKGVASTLLRTAHAWSEERHLRNVLVEMQSKNYPAIGLVLKNDYEFCGYNDRYYKNQDVMLVFSRGI